MSTSLRRPRTVICWTLKCLKAAPAWDKPSRRPSKSPFVEDVTGSRNLGQSWDGNGCQSHQDDEQRVHGTSSSCTNKAPETSAAGRAEPAIQVCPRSCRESLIPPEVS